MPANKDDSLIGRHREEVIVDFKKEMMFRLGIWYTKCEIEEKV
jgi:hypothetical protein